MAERKSPAASRQAKYAERNKRIGLVQVAAWVPAEHRYALSRIAESARADAAGVAADYVTALASEHRRESDESFWMSGGQSYALFKNLHDGEKAIAVKVIPWRCRPILVAIPVTPDTDLREVASQHPQLARIIEMRKYHWETPEYRRVCVDLGLDPDEGRPEFREHYKGLGEKLIVWVEEHFSPDEPWEDEPPFEAEMEDDELEEEEDWHRPRFGHPAVRRSMALNAVCDFVDLLRVDAAPTPAEVDDVRRQFSHFPAGMLPFDKTLREMVHGEEFLALGRMARRLGEAPRPGHNAGRTSVVVELLPSRYGTGNRAIFTSDFGTGVEADEDGWPQARYRHTRGVAVEPSAKALAASSWLAIVVQRLKRQGVLFLPEDQVQTYLDTEGTYWLHREGAFRYYPLKRPVRTPSWGERMMWRLKAPSMPVDRELARREALNPVH